MLTHLQAIEFIGGPFDGHKEIVAAEAQELVGMIALPVCEETFSRLEGHAPCGSETAASVAVYHRTWENGQCRYYFLGAALVSAPEAEHAWA